MGYYIPVVGDELGEVGGRDLRYLLTWLLRTNGRPLAVCELVDWCQQAGVELPGRPSKVISDSLRWEVAWGRVRRVRRGVYCFVGMPRSTWCWIRRRVEAVLAHVLWARKSRSGESEGPAPVWGPDVTTPPGSGRRRKQPRRPQRTHSVGLTVLGRWAIL